MAEHTLIRDYREWRSRGGPKPDTLPSPPTSVGESPRLRVADAGKRAQCGRSTVYAEVQGGRLRGARLGGGRGLRIRAECVDAWLHARASRPEGRSCLQLLQNTACDTLRQGADGTVATNGLSARCTAAHALPIMYLTRARPGTRGPRTSQRKRAWRWAHRSPPQVALVRPAEPGSPRLGRWLLLTFYTSPCRLSPYRQSI